MTDETTTNEADANHPQKPSPEDPMYDMRINGDYHVTWRDLDIALEQVNSIRIALAIGEGKLSDLPRGVIGDKDQCVLARALSNGWKAEVHPDLIILTHPGDGDKPNFAKCAASLVASGFEDVRVQKEGHYTDAGEWVEDKEPSSIQLEATREMKRLISAFDDGMLSWLILENED